jgi:hypothetical protein
VVDLTISLWGMALNGVIAGVISTLTLLVNLVRIAETAKLQRKQKQDVEKVVDDLKEGEKLDFEAFYEAMEAHAHTDREEAQAIFDEADVERTGLLTKLEAERMIKHWHAPKDVEEQTPQQAAAAALVAAAHKAAREAGAASPAGSPNGSPKAGKPNSEFGTPGGAFMTPRSEFAPSSAARSEAAPRKHGEEAQKPVKEGSIGGGSSAASEEPQAEVKEESWVRVIGVFLVFMFFIVPATLLLAALIFGAMLADAEGWDWHDGFLYVITNLCILGGELTPATPNSDRGRTIDVIIGLWTLSVQGTVIGVVGTLSIHERLVKMAESINLYPSNKSRRSEAWEAGEEPRRSEAINSTESAPKSKLQHLEMELGSPA